MQFSVIPCQHCRATFYTANDLASHHLDAHERPLPTPQAAVWSVQPRAERYVPPNYKAQAAALNGVVGA